MTIHPCCCEWHYFILFNGQVIFRCVYVPHLINLFLCRWNSGCFHVLAIANRAAVDTGVHTSFGPCFSLDIFPGVRLLDHEVRGSCREYQTVTVQEQQRGATPRPRSGGVAERRYPASEVRGCSREELRHAPKPEARGGGPEEQPTPEARGGDERSYPYAPSLRPGVMGGRSYPTSLSPRPRAAAGRSNPTSKEPWLRGRKRA